MTNNELASYLQSYTIFSSLFKARGHEYENFAADKQLSAFGRLKKAGIS